jgi:hypothetical protein
LGSTLVAGKVPESQEAESTSEAAVQPSSVPKRQTLSLFSKNKKPLKPKDASDARSNREFIIDFRFSMECPSRIAIVMNPFQLDVSKYDSVGSVDRPQFRSVISFCSFPFPLSTFKCRKPCIVELQRPFPIRHV